MTCVLVLPLVARLAWAVGGTALDAVNFVTGARAAGSGGAAVAAAEGPTALQWNPARLAAEPGWSAALSHLQWVAGIRYSYAGLAFPLARGVLGLPLAGVGAASVQYLDYGEIESTQGLKPAEQASDLGVSLGAGFAFARAFAAGGTLKAYRHALAGGSTAEGAADVGVSYRRGTGDDGTSFALVLQNLGYAGALDGRRPPLPVSVKGGVAYGFSARHDLLIPLGGRTFMPSLGMTYLLLGDVTVYEHKGPVNFRAGLEAGMNRFLYLRAGYLQSFVPAGRNAGASAGVGVEWSSLRMDYAYGWLGELGQAQYVTLTLAPSRGEAKQAPTEGGAPPGSPEGVSEAREREGPSGPTGTYEEALALYTAKDYAAVRDRAQALVAGDPKHWQAWQLLGHARYALGETPGALEAYGQSLALNPDNAELKDWVAKLEAH